MGFNKGHMEFTTLDLNEGFHDVPGYPPGFRERILAGSLDEKNKRGNRSRLAGDHEVCRQIHRAGAAARRRAAFNLYFER